MVPRVVEAVTGLPARRSRQSARGGGPRRRYRPLRRGARPGVRRRWRARGDELHARRVLACAAMGDRPVFLHVDASDASAVSRLDPVRGAADRSVPRGHRARCARGRRRGSRGDLGVDGADVGRGAARGPAPRRRPAARGRCAHSMPPPGAGSSFEAEDGALWLRTIVVPAAEDESETAGAGRRDRRETCGRQPHSGGAPGLVTAAHGQRLLVAVRTRGPAGSRAAGVPRGGRRAPAQVDRRQAGPWLSTGCRPPSERSSSRAASTPTARSHRSLRDSATSRAWSSTPSPPIAVLIPAAARRPWSMGTTTAGRPTDRPERAWRGYRQRDAPAAPAGGRDGRPRPPAGRHR